MLAALSFCNYGLHEGDVEAMVFLDCGLLRPKLRLYYGIKNDMVHYRSDYG